MPTKSIVTAGWHRLSLIDQTHGVRVAHSNELLKVIFFINILKYFSARTVFVPLV